MNFQIWECCDPCDVHSSQGEDDSSGLIENPLGVSRTPPPVYPDGAPVRSSQSG